MLHFLYPNLPVHSKLMLLLILVFPGIWGYFNLISWKFYQLAHFCFFTNMVITFPLANFNCLSLDLTFSTFAFGKQLIAYLYLFLPAHVFRWCIKKCSNFNTLCIDTLEAVMNTMMNKNIITPCNQYKFGGLPNVGTKRKTKNKLYSSMSNYIWNPSFSNNKGKLLEFSNLIQNSLQSKILKNWWNELICIIELKLLLQWERIFCQSILLHASDRYIFIKPG